MGNVFKAIEAISRVINASKDEDNNKGADPHPF